MRPVSNLHAAPTTRTYCGLRRSSVTGSFGLATFPEDGNSVQAIIRAADTMMYHAKTTRDNVSVAGLGLVAGAANGVQLPVGKTSTMLAADMATTQHLVRRLRSRLEPRHLVRTGGVVVQTGQASVQITLGE